MGRRESKGEGVRLGEVRVRPVRDAEERRRWDELVARDHYLPFKGLFGKGLRHVAEQGEAWLALVGWQAGAFKIGVRDKWIGWTAEQQFQRLHLIANNARFNGAGGRAGSESGIAGSGAEPAPGGGRHAGAAWLSGAFGGDDGGPVALCGDLLPRQQLAVFGVDAGVFARARRHGALAAARSTEGGVGVSPCQACALARRCVPTRRNTGGGAGGGESRTDGGGGFVRVTASVTGKYRGKEKT